MGNISLTKILFAGLISTFVIGILFGIYSNYIFINGATIDEPYNTAFQQIASQYDEFEGVADTVKDEGLVKNILDFGKNAITGTVNVFVVGLQAIGSFFSMVPVIGNLVSIISETIPGFSAILGLFSVLFAVYLAMAYIKSVSNKPDLP